MVVVQLFPYRWDSCRSQRIADQVCLPAGFGLASTNAQRSLRMNRIREVVERG